MMMDQEQHGPVRLSVSDARCSLEQVLLSERAASAHQPRREVCRVVGQRPERLAIELGRNQRGHKRCLATVNEGTRTEHVCELTKRLLAMRTEKSAQTPIVIAGHDHGRNILAQRLLDPPEQRLETDR